jgi:hypothetical protein
MLRGAAKYKSETLAGYVILASFGAKKISRSIMWNWPSTHWVDFIPWISQPCTVASEIGFRLKHF